MQVFFERREEIVPGIWQYYFRPEHTPDFVPGQYADLHLPNVKNDPRGASRTFSFTSLPSDESVSFVLKHFQLQTPYKYALQQMQQGDSARIGDAMGDLVLPKSTDLPLVFIAGGIGIASYASMLKDLLKRREERNIFLFYALHSAREQIFRDLTTSYPLALKTVAISPNHLTARQVLDSTPPDSLIYLSGSQNFVESMQKGFEALGIPRSQIIFDYFDGYADL